MPPGIRPAFGHQKISGALGIDAFQLPVCGYLDKRRDPGSPCGEFWCCRDGQVPGSFGREALVWVACSTLFR